MIPRVDFRQGAQASVLRAVQCNCQLGLPRAPNPYLPQQLIVSWLILLESVADCVRCCCWTRHKAVDGRADLFLSGAMLFLSRF